MVKSIIVAIAIVSISGCASAPITTAPAQEDLTFKLDQFQKDTAIGLFDLSDIKWIGKFLDSPGQSVNSGIREYKRWWCINSNDVERNTEDLFKKHCADKGGSWDGTWCRSSNDEPVFFAEVGGARLVAKDISGRPCSVGRDIAIVAATGEFAPSQQDWIAKARTYGYRSQTEMAFSQKKAEDEKRDRDLGIQQDRRHAAYAILTSGVGTQICKGFQSSLGTIINIGFVEKIENGKIKVTISDAQFENTTFRPGGFSQSVIWDAPENWYPCQYQSNDPEGGATKLGR